MTQDRARQLATVLGWWAVVLGAFVVARRAGGGVDPIRPPPEPERVEPAVARAHASGASGEQVAIRLVDQLTDARVDAPSARSAEPLFNAYWRKTRVPWSTARGEGARFATSVALVGEGGERPFSLSMPSGGEWSPDAKQWNMNEGTFDQREAIYAPTPATFAFKIHVPLGAKLVFTPGTMNRAADAVVFTVTVIDAHGAAHELLARRVPPSLDRRWLDEEVVDLSAFAGASVELRLRTTTAQATADEKAVTHKPKVWLPAKKPSAATPSTPEPSAATPTLGAAPTGSAAPSAAAAPAKRPAAAPSADHALSVPSPMALALWGNPTIVASGETDAPYDIVWIVVDALRADVPASFHDEASDVAMQSAKLPPEGALLPRIDGLTPAIDALAARGVRLTHAYSVAPWTRPGTIAMLAGTRSSEIGIDSLHWQVKDTDADRFYASSPPLLPLLMRARGVVTRAFVNNFFMSSYAPVGLDLGFERLFDVRDRTKDTATITEEATAWIKAHAAERFFAFVNYNSPHEPWEPPAAMVARVPSPPAGPKDPGSRLYMAEAAKDDEAIGEVLGAIDSAGLRDRTIVVVTADHGETLSGAHAAKVSGLDNMSMLHHHAIGNYEETLRVPLIIVAPGLAARTVAARVRSIDIVPTILDLESVDAADARAKMTGRSLVPLMRGEPEPDERVVLSEGRGTRTVLVGSKHLIVRDPIAQKLVVSGTESTVTEELYDLADDPGERHDLARQSPDAVAEMRARLDAAFANVPAAGTTASLATNDAGGAFVHLRFAGAGGAHRVAGTLVARAGTIAISGFGLGPEVWKVDGASAEVAFTTVPEGIVGLDVRTEPPGSPLAWDFTLDDAPWPADRVYAGPFGIAAPKLIAGLTTDDARSAASSSAAPWIDSAKDLGLFVTRDVQGEAPRHVRESSPEAAEEMGKMLRAWGYAQGGGR